MISFYIILVLTDYQFFVVEVDQLVAGAFVATVQISSVHLTRH